MSQRVQAPDLRRFKEEGRKIVMLTAYDYPFARLLDRAGVDVFLVGDSLGMAVLGYESTLPVTLADILRCTQAVVRGARRALVVADMPFLSYQADRAEAMRNAGRLLQEGGAQAVKVEGGKFVAPTVQALVEAGIPTMGHLGLTPQAVNRLGGYRLQAATREGASQLLEDAKALEAAGAFAVVLEKVPVEAARAVSEALSIPTIGIGAGPACDGQVLVLHDILGLFEAFQPRFAKRYANLGEIVEEAARRFAQEVREGTFPGPEHSYRSSGRQGAGDDG